MKDTKHIASLIAEKENRLKKLQLKQAKKGINAEVELEIEIEEIEAELETLQAKLQGLEAHNFANCAKAYQSYLKNKYQFHTMRGFAPQVGGKVVSLPLSKIFLPLKAVEGRPALAEYAEADLHRQAEAEVGGGMDWFKQQEEIEKRYAYLSARQSGQRTLTLAQLLSHKRAILLGDPGSGKTTVTCYITYALAAADYEHTGFTVKGLSPILIRLATYAKIFDQDPTLNLIDYISGPLLERADFGAYLKRQVQAGNALIILDGLDEVSSVSLRLAVIERIQTIVASYPDNHFLVTSRIVGYEQSPLTRDFQHVTLQDLTQADKERFVGLWYEAIKNEMNQESRGPGAKALIEALQNKPQVARLAANPLLLTIMVLMHWRGTKLPSRRVQVYQIATDTLIEHWTELRMAKVDLDAEEIKAILAPIAHRILSSSVGGVIAKHNLWPLFEQGIIEQRGCNKQEARRIRRAMLKDLSEQSGLFLERGLDSEGQPVYGFLHQTFGEYLAALHIAQAVLNNNLNLKHYIHQAIWQEPLLLLAGHLSLFSVGHTNTLLQAILDHPTPYDDTLQRNLFLAADCLADDIKLAPKLRDEILSGLAEGLRNPAPQVQKAALARYKAMAATRHAEQATTLLKNTLPPQAAPTNLKPDIRLNLATAFLYLGQQVSAAPLLTALLDDKESSYDIKQKIHRLRIEYWPAEAAAYLLDLHADEQYGFSIGVGSQLSDCTLGPINADVVLKGIGFTAFQNLCYSLAQNILNKAQQKIGRGDEGEGVNQNPASFHIKLLHSLAAKGGEDNTLRGEDREALAKLAWIVALANPNPSPELFLPLLNETIAPAMQCRAATHLLRHYQHPQAVNTLHHLLKTEAKEANNAAAALHQANLAVDLDQDLLKDVAFLVNDNNQAPEAIATLLRGTQSNWGLAAALHFIATAPYNGASDYGYQTILTALMESDYRELGIALAQWLALRPGYNYRFEACMALIEAKHLETTTPYLKYLAYETHGEGSYKACQRLLVYKEANLVAPVLQQLKDKGDAEQRYQACLALALSQQPEGETPIDMPSRIDLKCSILVERTDAYNKAWDKLLETVFNTLAHLNPKTDAEKAAVQVAKGSWAWVLSDDDTPTPNLYTLPLALPPALQTLTTHYPTLPPVLSLTLARFHLRVGNFQTAETRLTTLLTPPHTLSSPVYCSTLHILGQMISPKTLPFFINAARSQDKAVRLAATIPLGYSGHPAAFEPLVTLLGDEELTVRLNAVQALGNFGDERAVPVLIEMLGTEDDFSGIIMGIVLNQLRIKEIVPDLLKSLNRHAKSPNKQSQIVDTLRFLSFKWQVSDSEMVRSLIPIALNPKVGFIDTVVSNLLKHLNKADLLSPIIEAVNHEQAPIKCRAIGILSEVNNPQTIPILLNVLDDTDETVRVAVAKALGNVITLDNVEYPQTKSALLGMLQDTKSSVRQAVVQALGQFDDPQILPALLKSLEDEDSQVQREAIKALSEQEDPQVMQALIGKLDDEDSNVRQAVIKALNQATNPTIAPQLIPLLGNETSGVRYETAIALGHLNYIKAIPYLLAALSDNDSSVRYYAITTLAQLNAQEAIAPLITILNNGYNEQAIIALSKFGIRPIIPLLVAHLSNPRANNPRADKVTISTALAKLGVKEAVPLLVALSPSVQGYQASQYALALIHLEPVAGLALVARYNKQFKHKNWAVLQGQAYWQLGQMQQALHYFKQGVAHEDSFEALLALSHYYLEQDDLSQATSYLKQAEEGPKSDWAKALCQLQHAILYRLQGQRGAAQQALKDAKKLNANVVDVDELKYQYFWRAKAVETLFIIKN